MFRLLLACAELGVIKAEGLENATNSFKQLQGLWVKDFVPNLNIDQMMFNIDHYAHRTLI